MRSSAPRSRATGDVLRDELLGHGRDDEHVGLCWLPGGDEMYTGLARIHTTTDRTPDDLHQTGLDVIAAARRRVRGARLARVRHP